MSTAESRSATRSVAARSPWQIFALLATAQFIVVLDTSVVYIALPSIQRDVGFNDAGLAWVMDAYILAFGGFLLLGGRAADLFGRRRVLVVGLVLFLLASLACGLADEAWILVAARAAQGFAAAVVSPSAMSLVTDTFPPGPDRYKALGMFGGVGGLAGATGVLIGGLLTSVGWQWAFLVNIPLVLIVLALVVRMVPSAGRAASGTLDLPGALLGSAGVCLGLYAIISGGGHGWDPTVFTALGGAVLLLVGFVLRQLRAATPLVPRSLFRLSNVVLGNLANAAAGALMFGMFFVVTLHLQAVRGYPPLVAALAMAPISVALFLGSQVTIRRIGRLGPVRALGLGMAAQAVAALWWALTIVADSGFVATFLLPGVLFGAGLGASIVGAFVVCTDRVSGAEQGAASGLVNTTLQLGGAIGVAVLGTIATRQAAGAAQTGLAPAEALSAGHVLAFAVCCAIAVCTVPIVFWLGRVWHFKPIH